MSKRMIKIISAVAIIGMSPSLFAAGGGTGTVFDLIAPAFNFLCFSIPLLYFIRKQAIVFCQKNSEEIKNRYTSSVAKQAQLEKDVMIAKGKLANLGHEEDQLKTKAMTDLKNYLARLKEDNEKQKEKMTSDMNARVKTVTHKLMLELETKILAKLISDVKVDVQKDSSLKNKVENKYLSVLK